MVFSFVWFEFWNFVLPIVPPPSFIQTCRYNDLPWINLTPERLIFLTFRTSAFLEKFFFSLILFLRSHDIKTKNSLLLIAGLRAHFFITSHALARYYASFCCNINHLSENTKCRNLTYGVKLFFLSFGSNIKLSFAYCFSASFIQTCKYNDL